LKRGRSILRTAVDIQMRAELSSQLGLIASTSDRHGAKPHAASKLNAKVSEPAESLNGDQVARTRR
jgi:hypothetical protein